ncbi:hypothetical protein BDZ97DRAFT_38184 [Flammula alnicola]|nr:hypothetical protein BDZ97DRAFT_38184 [Flammula alnicola]
MCNGQAGTMSCIAESTVLSPRASITTSEIKTTKSMAKDALEANKRLQQILTQRAERLEAELKEADQLLTAATVEESQDEPESDISIPGAKKATGLFPPSEFLNPASPFYEEAAKRTSYLTNINPHPLKPKDLEILADAVRQENERLQAYNQSCPQRIDLENNVEGLDWARIAEKVSDASSVKRTATDCQITWIADKHPTVNHAEWSADEIDRLNSLVSEYTREKKTIDWVTIAQKLGTNRIPIDCMRHGIPRHRHSWSPESDQKLIQAVESCGIDNWQLVARKVSEHVSAGQCQNRWQKTLNPALRKGAWTEDEDERLRKAVAGYGSSWVHVATAIPGRTNDQCRERWTEHLKLSSAKIIWTEEEDKILLDTVKDVGNQWKAISFKLGSNKTGQNCRMRYDKLKRMQKSGATVVQGNASSSTASTFLMSGPSQLIPTPVPEQGRPTASPLTNMHEFSSHPEVDTVDPAAIPKPRPKSRAKGKGKQKESGAGGSHVPQTAQPQIDEDRPTASGMDVVEPQAPPAKRRRKTAATEVENTRSGSTYLGAVNEPASKPRPKPRPRIPKGGKTVEAAPETTAPQSHIKSSSTAADGVIPPISAPDTTSGTVPTRGRKRKAADPSESETRKGTKAPKVASKTALEPTTIHFSETSNSDSIAPLQSAAAQASASFNVSTLDANLELELQRNSQEQPQPRKRGRPRKVVPPPEAKESPQAKETLPLDSSARSDNAPLRRTRQQTRKSQAAPEASS